MLSNQDRVDSEPEERIPFNILRESASPRHSESRFIPPTYMLHHRSPPLHAQQSKAQLLYCVASVQNQLNSSISTQGLRLTPPSKHHIAIPNPHLHSSIPIARS
ncbi:uncharacterized protein LAJ45_08827 [Morchella importuna]|uniref:uncharacterized protein n=1 Tax=Morchella importuna TaxID=1174673 RepID=UPI001E8D7178|nr:uncharacterized protein LAJ45_08827 [Morchella importuna]KAH8147028.1 hypothetical protein LAJ45_08827 [Morchella importuna]